MAAAVCGVGGAVNLSHATMFFIGFICTENFAAFPRNQQLFHCCERTRQRRRGPRKQSLVLTVAW